MAGWWDHPYLNQDIARLRATLETYHARPYKVVANVAMIYSQEAYYFSGSTAQQNPVSESLTHSSSQDIHFAGAAVDAFDLCDLERIDWDQYRAVFFGNVFFLSEPQRRFIRERVAQNGRHLFWNYLPGYTDGTRNDRAFVEELTGFKLGMMTPAEKTQVNVTAPGLPAAIFEGREPAKPVPVVQDSSAEALGCFAGTKEVGFARKKASTHTAWFASLPMRNADLFRAMFQLAGVHIYSDGGDVVYAGGGILSIHTISGGARRICLRNGQSLDLNLPPASTTILDEETGAVLMA